MKIFKSPWFWLVVVIFIFISATISKPATQEIKQEPKQEVVEVAKQSIYDEVQMKEFKEGYIRGCNTDGISAKYCECSYEHLISNLGQDKFLDMAMRYAVTEIITPELSDAMIEAAIYCTE